MKSSLWSIVPQGIWCGTLKIKIFKQITALHKYIKADKTLSKQESSLEHFKANMKITCSLKFKHYVTNW